MHSSALYTGIAVVLAVLVIIIFFFFPNYLRGLSSSPDISQSGTASDTSTQSQAPAATAPAGPTSLTMQDVSVGTGAEAKSGDTVVVEYTGKLADGTVFDSTSMHGNQVMPGCDKAGQFCFILGAGQVIPGWDQGIAGMKVGGERTLVIPPSLAYGSQGVGPIPPNATLTFDVKLVAVKPTTGNTPYAPTGPAAD